MSVLRFMIVVAFVVVVVGLGACRKDIPMPAVKITAEEAQLARGKYLADHVMGCGGCHAQRDWTKLSGPVVDGTAYSGSLVFGKDDGFPESFHFNAPNLTPHNLKDWSDGEIARAVALGQSKDGRGLFPMMPYYQYREALAVDDLGAIVAYLRSLPAVPSDKVEPKFPIPGFVMDGFPKERALREKAPMPGDADYPKYVTTIAACVECHTKADERGRMIGTPFAGGREFVIHTPGAGKVRSTNLTPDPETGIGAWTKEQFVGRFRSQTVEAVRAQSIESGGFNTVMPWSLYAGMTEEDLGAIYDHLKSLPAEKNLVEKYAKP